MERIEMLRRLDADRWEDARPHQFVIDADVHHDVATWIFDRTGGIRGPGRHDYDDEGLRAAEEALAELKPEIDAALGLELGEVCMQAWREGRHDT
jgi:hypothetical protein